MKRRTFFTVTFLFLLANIFYAKEYSPEESQKLRNAVTTKAKSFIGCPYKTGAIGPNSFDCSGLIYTCFREGAGIQLPRSVKAIYSAVKIVPSSQLEEGDLVFFKTSGNNTINHIGIYIGRNQFIHAASDGANTGVIASSLTEKYYKGCFAGVGKVLTSTKKASNKNADEQDIPEETIDENGTVISSEYSSSNSRVTPNSTSSKKTNSSSKGLSFASKIEFDGSLTCDWSFWLPNKFMINFRGVTTTIAARYTGWQVQPSIGTTFRWNYGCDCFQIPILFGLKFNDYVGIYVGPVFSIGEPKLPNTNTKIQGSVFPGVLGLSVNTPSFNIGKVKLSFCQDFNYTIFNDTDGGALKFFNSLESGFSFSTGVRVTLPMKNVLK